ncbi:MAG: tripartite tricarboxylate transporter permease [Rhodospirillales bacterium]|nr:tripartite tricarboxylate transporter permease [Rhodospirillales bacterium]MDH3920517.1 tripartite tricarboxylate transporter permease [Rhodospirillales bacterium]MDH3969816.1 tripartite tricarboxylate transporter permease [Rhodospirillales bacterium]
MEILNLLAGGFAIVFEPLNLALVVFGCAIGLFVGAMPGLGSVNGVAILLPMTFLVPPESAIIFLAALYYGAMYGGAISSIMLGIPGASTAVATTFDGRPLALQGKADVALIAAAVASFVGGTISVVLFTLFAPPLAEIALTFGSPEIFALMVLAFATFIGLGGDDIPKTLFSIFIGLAMSAVGLDIISGQPRLIFFGLPGFYHGINFLVLAIGIYGIGEMLWTVEVSRGKMSISQATMSLRRIIDGVIGLKSSIKTMLMGSFLGYFVGILPAAGATPGSLMAYGVAKTISKDPGSFGKGNVDGVVAPEAANNAASTGAMLPMLTLGIPGSPTTAILLGGMVIWGLEPGPLLFVEHSDFVWGLIASLYAANLFALLINVAFIPAFIWVLRMPFTILAPIIFVLCIVGGYAPTQDMHDVWLMLIFGIVGYLMRKLDYPLAPAVLAIVLGPLAEPALRQSLLISNGSFAIFFERPFAGVIMVIALGLLVLPVLQKMVRYARRPA